MVNCNTISLTYVLMSWVLDCMMKETIILNALLKKDSHINVTSLADPGEYQHMIIKYLSVGQISKFIYQQIALDVLFQMRYGSLVNSDKWPNGKQKGADKPFFSSLQYCCFPSCFCLSGAHLKQHA